MRLLENGPRLRSRHDALGEGTLSTARNLGAQRNGCACERASGEASFVRLCDRQPKQRFRPVRVNFS